MRIFGGNNAFKTRFYAKENFRTEKTINQIKNISNIIKQNFSD